MRAQDRRGSSPSPQTRRPRRTGTVTAGLGTNHGKTPTQDPHGLHRLPCFHPHPAPNRVIHGVITGELDDRKRSRPVRPGGHWKRACSAGTSPVAYRHRGRGQQPRRDAPEMTGLNVARDQSSSSLRLPLRTTHCRRPRSHRFAGRSALGLIPAPSASDRGVGAAGVSAGPETASLRASGLPRSGAELVGGFTVPLCA
jgi:hypothetical protein